MFCFTSQGLLGGDLQVEGSDEGVKKDMKMWALGFFNSLANGVMNPTEGYQKM